MPAPPFGEAAALTTELTWLEVVVTNHATAASQRRLKVPVKVSLNPSSPTGKLQKSPWPRSRA